MKCFLGHDWTKWGEPELRQNSYVILRGQASGKTYTSNERWQVRSCKNCNKREERNITNEL